RSRRMRWPARPAHTAPTTGNTDDLEGSCCIFSIGRGRSDRLLEPPCRSRRYFFGFALAGRGTEGFANWISSAACFSDQAPAAGSAPPRSGSLPPPIPRSHWPSDSPGILIQTYASTSGLPVRVVGRAPRPRSGGLHQVCASLYAVPALGAHEPLPLRLVSITKCVSGPALPTLSAYHFRLSAQVA